MIQGQIMWWDSASSRGLFCNLCSTLWTRTDPVKRLTFSSSTSVTIGAPFRATLGANSVRRSLRLPVIRSTPGLRSFHIPFDYFPVTCWRCFSIWKITSTPWKNLCNIFAWQVWGFLARRGFGRGIMLQQRRWNLLWFVTCFHFFYGSSSCSLEVIRSASTRAHSGRRFGNGVLK